MNGETINMEPTIKLDDIDAGLAEPEPDLTEWPSAERHHAHHPGSSTRTTGSRMDHGRFKAQFRPMRGLKRDRTALAESFHPGQNGQQLTCVVDHDRARDGPLLSLRQGR